MPATSRPQRSRTRRAFTFAALSYIGFNVVASGVGVIARLPDVTSTHATTDHVPLAQVIFPDGTIISPPLGLMVVAGLLLWGAVSDRHVLGTVCTLLLVLGAALTSIAEVSGLANRPSLFSPDRWDIAIAVGSLYGVVGLGAVVAGAGYLYSELRVRRRVTATSR